MLNEQTQQANEILITFFVIFFYPFTLEIIKEILNKLFSFLILCFVCFVIEENNTFLL